MMIRFGLMRIRKKRAATLLSKLYKKRGCSVQKAGQPRLFSAFSRESALRSLDDSRRGRLFDFQAFIIRDKTIDR